MSMLYLIKCYLFQKMDYDDFYQQCSPEAIPDKTQRNRTTRQLATKLEEMHGRHKVKVRLELDPFRDVRKEILRQRSNLSRDDRFIRAISVKIIGDRIVTLPHQ